MVIKRKLFSKEVERKKSDKTWDSVLGAGLGATAGVIGSNKLAKVTEVLRNTDDKDFIKEENTKNDFYKKSSKLKDINKDLHLSPDEIVDQMNKRMEIDSINKKSQKALKKFRLKKRVAKVGIVAIPVAGAIIGAAYGHQNNLKKQRNKIEDAAGDRVADIVRGKKNK